MRNYESGRFCIVILAIVIPSVLSEAANAILPLLVPIALASTAIATAAMLFGFFVGYLTRSVWYLAGTSVAWFHGGLDFQTRHSNDPNIDTLGPISISGSFLLIAFFLAAYGEYKPEISTRARLIFARLRRT
jgi:hypothetical protein